MTRPALPVALAALAALAAPAFAQTDDRVLNDIVTLVRANATIDQAVTICLAADIDLAADRAGWLERNGATLAQMDRVAAMRGGFGPGVLDAARDEAASAFAAAFVDATDRTAYCEQVGETIDAGDLDLATWFPVETTRLAEAEEGKWPPLDLEGAVPVADAVAVKQFAFMIADVFARCGVLVGDPGRYDDAAIEWQARNGYSVELADRILRNWGALDPARWENARNEAGAEVDALVADKEAFETHCAGLAARVMNGDEDLDLVRPELYQSVQTNAEIVP